MVSGYMPGGVPLFVVTVIVALPVVEIEDGDTEAETP